MFTINEYNEFTTMNNNFVGILYCCQFQLLQSTKYLKIFLIIFLLNIFNVYFILPDLTPI